jgi:hypothetical protein
MRKLTLTLAAAALVLGTMAVQANAQNQHRGAAVFKNATPIVTPGGMQRKDGSLRLWRRLGQRLWQPVLRMPSL